MADRKPPRSDDGDAAVLRSLLRYQRESFARKMDGVTDDDARRSPVASGTSLLWLANHMADAETVWVLDRFRGLKPGSSSTPPAETLAGAVDRYRSTWPLVDEVIDGADGLDAACPTFDDGPATNLRWIVAHLLEETARHAGHADILRELIDDAVGR